MKRVYITKMYGTGDDGDFCRVDIFNDKIYAENHIKYLFLSVIKNDLGFDQYDIDGILEMVNNMEYNLEWESEDEMITISYNVGTSFSIRDHNNEMRVIGEIEEKNF